MQSASFAKMVGLAGLAGLIVSMEGIILLPILTKTLGVHQYGIWALVNATISLAVPLATIGLGNSIVRLLASKTNNRQISTEFFSVFFIVLFTGTIIAITVASVSALLFPLFNKGADSFYFIIGSAMIILWSARSLLLIFFQTFRQFGEYATFTILYVLIETGLASYLVLSGYGLTGAIGGMIIANTIIVLLMLFKITTQVGFHGITLNVREYFSIGLPYVPVMLSGWILSSSDKYFLGAFKDASVVGIYSTTYAMSYLLMIFISAIIFALDPTISKLWDQGETGEVKQYLSLSLKYSLLLTIPSAFGISILGEYILQTMARPEFIPGAAIIPLLSIGMIANGIFYVFTSVLLLAKKTIYTTQATGIAAISSIILNIFLIPRYGIWGAATTAMIAYLLMMFFGFHISRRYIKFDLNMRFILKSVISAGIMSLVIMQLHPVGILQLITAVCIGAGVYGLMIILIGGITKNELVFFWNAFHFLKSNLLHP